MLVKQSFLGSQGKGHKMVNIFIWSVWPREYAHQIQTLYRSEVTGKVKVCTQTNWQIPPMLPNRSVQDIKCHSEIINLWNEHDVFMECADFRIKIMWDWQMFSSNLPRSTGQKNTDFNLDKYHLYPRPMFIKVK